MGILARAATTTLVHQKLDAIDILKNRSLGRNTRVVVRCSLINLVQPSLLVECDHLGDLSPVHLGRSKSQFLFERLLQSLDVAVLAEDQRHYQPVVAGADLAIRSVI